MERAPTSAEGSAVESHRPQTVRSGTFRSMALSLEKAFSIGLKSGLQGSTPVISQRAARLRGDNMDERHSVN